MVSLSSGVLSQKLLPPENGVYHSAFPDMGPSEDVVTVERVKDFEKLAGKEIAWAYFSDNWFDGIHFPWDETEAIRKAGSIPFIRIMPRSDWSDDKQDPQYSLQNIIDGKFDLDIHQYARDAKGFGTPLLIEFGTEVNGNWFPWSASFNGAGVTYEYGDPDIPDGPERFRDAYRHIIEIFWEERADNVTFFFHVDANSEPKDEWNNMKAYYPGDDYIDWIGISVYGAQQPGDEWIEFQSVLDDAIMEFTHISLNKPLAILEFGTIDGTESNSKSQWIKNALNYITSDKYPRIKAISYWHSIWGSEGDFSNMRIDSCPECLEIYKNIISTDYFISEPVFSK
jgi:hypothetical protein